MEEGRRKKIRRIQRFQNNKEKLGENSPRNEEEKNCEENYHQWRRTIEKVTSELKGIFFNNKMSSRTLPSFHFMPMFSHNLSKVFFENNDHIKLNHEITFLKLAFIERTFSFKIEIFFLPK